jgi:hypoxanthine phosphoribosyltransferase
MAQPKYEYLTNEQMNGYYADICRAMAGAQYRPDVIVALSRGGLDFGVKLSNWFDDVELVPLVWQTRDGSSKDSSTLIDIMSKYKYGNILVVDDMLDSGTTLEAVDAVASEHSKSSLVDYAVAIENTEAGFDVTWSARQIQRSEHEQWFVFPWENWWK